MREPGLVDGAVFAPGHCMICGGSEGAMVDTRVDIPGDGRMYLCVRLCVPLIAKTLGYMPPSEASRLTSDLGGMSRRVRELEDEVAQLEAVAQAIRSVRYEAVADPDPRALRLEDHPLVRDALAPRCSATKIDGSRCAARALRGHDTCVAHTRVKQPA